MEDTISTINAKNNQIVDKSIENSRELVSSKHNSSTLWTPQFYKEVFRWK